MPYSSTGKSPTIVETAVASKVPFKACQVILQDNGTAYYDPSTGSSTTDRIVLGSSGNGSGITDIPTSVYQYKYKEANTFTISGRTLQGRTNLMNSDDFLNLSTAGFEKQSDGSYKSTRNITTSDVIKVDLPPGSYILSAEIKAPAASNYRVRAITTTDSYSPANTIHDGTNFIDSTVLFTTSSRVTSIGFNYGQQGLIEFKNMQIVSTNAPTYTTPVALVDDNNATLSIYTDFTGGHGSSVPQKEVTCPYTLRSVRGLAGASVINCDCISANFKTNKVSYIQNIGVYTYTKADGTKLLNYEVSAGVPRVNLSYALSAAKAISASQSSLSGATSNYGYYCNFSGSTNSIGIQPTGNHIYIRQPLADFPDLNAFKTWLDSTVDDGTPFTVYYTLAEPVTTDITNTEFGKAVLSLKPYADRLSLTISGYGSNTQYAVSVKATSYLSDIPVFLNSGTVATVDDFLLADTLNGVFRINTSLQDYRNAELESAYALMIQTFRTKTSNLALPYVDQLLLFPTGSGTYTMYSRQVTAPITGLQDWTLAYDDSEFVRTSKFAGLKYITKAEMDDPNFDMSDGMYYIPEYTISTSFVSDYSVNGTTVTEEATRDIEIPLNNCLVYKTTRKDVTFNDQRMHSQNVARPIFEEEPGYVWVSRWGSDYPDSWNGITFTTAVAKGSKFSFKVKTETGPNSADEPNFHIRLMPGGQVVDKVIYTDYETVEINVEQESTYFELNITAGGKFYMKNVKVEIAANEQILQPQEPSQKHRSYSRQLVDGSYTDWIVAGSGEDDFITYTINIEGNSESSSNSITITPPTLITCRYALKNIHSLKISNPSSDSKAMTFLLAKPSSESFITSLDLPQNWLIEDGVIPVVSSGNYKFDIKRMQIAALALRPVVKIHKYATKSTSTVADPVVYIGEN